MKIAVTAMKSEPARGSEWLKQRSGARETKVGPLATASWFCLICPKGDLIRPY